MMNDKCDNINDKCDNTYTIIVIILYDKNVIGENNTAISLLLDAVDDCWNIKYLILVFYVSSPFF